ncbi:TrkA C-terminal domain-containing protein [Halalkalibacter hemicellulosilyticus]|uniref:TrkA domain protein n=1 Tax=Halalkalibacter hemicellulosilyticusJCM 9152 TaxID=1236971 RepID=W4QG40_9BACI|nr:TrkA C-terminal domain-containing protein [Halalkalibacter hemicellulosilyticus]GAE31060.1 TrkA domain protein [Halalkalibacter hemicellulosilyticusJCM 9152]
MEMNISNLPGVGKKITFINGDDQMMAIIVHYTGKRELYFFEHRDDDEAIFTFNLSSEETKQIGAQLLGATFNPLESDKLEKLKMARKDVIVEWIDIPKKSKVVGMMFYEVKKLVPQGGAIIGIFKGDDFIVDLAEDDQIERGDTIMLVGKKDAVDEFELICEGKGQ